jgi:hypothetical protein
MRITALILSVIGAAIAVAAVMLELSDWVFMLSGLATSALLLFALWPRKRDARVVLELGGLQWTEEDFCRGWEIDGRTGSGKTASGVVPIIYQLKKNRPDVGILALDTKGDLSEPLARIADTLKCQEQLVQLEVRPEKAPPDWKPAVTMNFLADTSIPYSTYAKILVDVATAAGQKGGQAFFKVASQTAIQNTFSALAALNRPVTVPACAEIIANLTKFKEMATSLETLAKTKPEMEPLVQYFQEFIKQPSEQLGGIRSTVFNYLQPFTAPDIAQVFCPEKPTFSLREIDQGKLVSVKIPQKYQVEKKYIGLLLKVLFYLHALRRYDLSYEERAQRNLIVMVLDEAQETVLVSEDGISDYNVIDKIRGARATTINSTQSPTSYIPPMGGKDKAEVFLLNLGNKIYFTAADNQASDMIADAIGKHAIKKRTYGRAAGKSTMSWKEEDEHWVKPHELRVLPKHQAIVRHCEKHFRKMHLKPTLFTLPPNGNAITTNQNVKR